MHLILVQEMLDDLRGDDIANVVAGGQLREGNATDLAILQAREGRPSAVACASRQSHSNSSPASSILANDTRIPVLALS